MCAGDSRGGCGCLEGNLPCGVGAIPVSVSPPVSVLGAVLWVIPSHWAVLGCFLTLLSVLKSISSCNRQGKVNLFGYGVGRRGLNESLQLMARLNGKIYPLVRLSYGE